MEGRAYVIHPLFLDHARIADCLHTLATTCHEISPSHSQEPLVHTGICPADVDKETVRDRPVMTLGGENQESLQVSDAYLPR